MHVGTQTLGEGGQVVLTETSSLGAFALGQSASQNVLSNSQGKANVEIYSFMMWSTLWLLLSPVSSHIHFLIIVVELQCNVTEVLHINSYMRW